MGDFPDLMLSRLYE